MSGRYDIAVAGGGPAGLACALLLEQAGHRVTLIERFKEPQPLGSGLILQPTGLAVLQELGLAAQLMAAGSRIDRLFGLNSRTNSIVLDVGYSALANGSFGIGLHRAALFDALFGLVQTEPIAIETGVEIADIEAGADDRPVLLAATGRRLGPFDLVVDALGTRSPLTRHAVRKPVSRALPYGALWANVPLGSTGFDPHALEQRYQRANVMVGVLPIGRHGASSQPLASFFWSIKPEAYENWRSAGLERWKADVIGHWPATGPLLDTISDPDQLILASYRHQTLPVPHGRRLAFIGDSAHSTSPQLGQGANMAMLDAFALARALETQADLGEALRHYARLRRWHVRLYQAASRMFTPFYQSDSHILPLIRDRAVPSLARLPGIDRLLAKLVAGLVLDPLRKLGLKAPSAENRQGTPASAEPIARA